MSRKITHIDPDDLVSAYLLTQNITDVGKQFGVSMGYAHKAIVGHTGKPLRQILLEHLRPKIVAAHESGMSVKAIADHVGKSRGYVVESLKSIGITPRNRSEAMYHRMANTDPIERKRLVKAANIAASGPRKESDLKTIAKGRQATMSKQGIGERAFQKLLDLRDVLYVPEKAVGRYNIDFVIGNLAVEVYRSYANPTGIIRNMEKIEHLRNIGMSALYIWKRPGHVLSLRHADYAIELSNLIDRHPSPGGQYWMIRGGENLCPTKINPV